MQLLCLALLMLGAFALAIILRERHRRRARQWPTYKDWRTYCNSE